MFVCVCDRVPVFVCLPADVHATGRFGRGHFAPLADISHCSEHIFCQGALCALCQMGSHRLLAGGGAPPFRAKDS